MRVTNRECERSLTKVAVIQFDHVSKIYGSKKAVDDISFKIEKGSVVAILGPNGAGKTTSVSMMLGLKKPTSGKVRLMNGDPRDPVTRKQIGAMLQDVDVIDRLTVRETVELFRKYYDKSMPTKRLLQIAGLEENAKMFAEKLSGGQKRRLNFALALAGNPDVLFLDEPTVGMDVTSRRVFWDTLRAFANGGKTIILTTHYLEEADAIADRVIVIDQGKKVADGSPGELKASLGGKYITFTAGYSVQPEALKMLPGVEYVEWSGRHVKVVTHDTDQMLFTLIQNKFEIRDIHIHSGGLEEVFQNLVGTTAD
jgi:ABC-2 type transport system ATP-binding protein